MARYLELRDRIARSIASGELGEGTALPSVRSLAETEATTPSTVRRALESLGEAGVVETEERRRARVASGGQLAALALLRGHRVFRLAGSDDPALDLLLRTAGEGIELVGKRGSFPGLVALWQGRADGAVVHLRHRSGVYNSPYARALLRDENPALVHLWRREQGILLPEDGRRRIDGIGDLEGCRIAKREFGTGTRILLDRLLLDAGLDPDNIAGPEVSSHLEVGLAVASGVAEAGIGVRSLAQTLALDFVPLLWEDYDLVLRGDELGGVESLVSALKTTRVRRAIDRLGGYEVSSSGEIVHLR